MAGLPEFALIPDFPRLEIEPRLRRRTPHFAEFFRQFRCDRNYTFDQIGHLLRRNSGFCRGGFRENALLDQEETDKFSGLAHDVMIARFGG